MKCDRARALVCKDKKILVIHRYRDGCEYYVLPGGHVEEGETKETTVIRELKEETSVSVILVELIHSLIDVDGSTHYVYKCDYVSGEPRLGEGSEERLRMTKENIYEPMWLDIVELPELVFWPVATKDFLMNYFNVFQVLYRKK